MKATKGTLDSGVTCGLIKFYFILIKIEVNLINKNGSSKIILEELYYWYSVGHKF